MAAKALPAQDVLNQLLEYNPETGELTWRSRPEVDRFVVSWNKRWAGQPGFRATQSRGYRCGAILGKVYLAHRIIWKLVTGTEPDTIDHINGDKTDNRWENLRSVSNADNHRNMPLQQNNTSGHPGVSWYARDEIWVANITIDGKPKYLGRFQSKPAAIAARKEAEAESGFHLNHGR